MVFCASIAPRESLVLKAAMMVIYEMVTVARRAVLEKFAATAKSMPEKPAMMATAMH
jgi:hypothetical protein